MSQQFVEIVKIEPLPDTFAAGRERLIADMLRISALTQADLGVVPPKKAK